MSGADYRKEGAVAVIRLDNPPVNGLAHAVRAGILAGLDKANQDPAVKAIVLTGAGKAFSGGADINEFGTPKALAEPNLLTVIRAIERSDEAGRRRDPRRSPWAAASSWRSAATTASPRRARRSRCRK